MYKLRSWICKEQLNWAGLSYNKNAIKMLNQNPDKICYDKVAMNENIMLLDKNIFSKIKFEDIVRLNINIIFSSKEYCEKLTEFAELSANPLAMPILEEHPEWIDWYFLSDNPSEKAIRLLEQNPDKIDWEIFSRNQSKYALPLFEKNIDKLNWEELSANPIAISLLKKYPENIVWETLSMNEAAIDILEQNEDKIDWYLIHYNKNAIHMIKKNIENMEWSILCYHPSIFEILEKYPEYRKNIDWYSLSANPDIFIYDYESMRNHFYETYGKELIEYMNHPKYFDFFMDIE